MEVASNDEFGEVSTAFNMMLEQRRRTEELLRKSEKKFRSLFNDAQDMIHIVDRDGKIVDANPRELEVLGYTREEYVGRRLADFIHPDFKGTTGRAFKRALEGNKIDFYETVLIDRNGGEV